MGDFPTWLSSPRMAHAPFTQFKIWRENWILLKLPFNT